MTNDSPIDRVDWKELRGKEARGVDKNVDLGEIQEIGSSYVITQKGRVSRDKFYIPKYLAQRYDGKKVWFNVTDAMMAEFNRESPPIAEEYARYKKPDTPLDIEDRLVVVSQVPVSTEGIKEVETIEEITIPTEATTTTTMTPATSDSPRDLPVLEWENTLHKGVRTMDGEPVGNVIALYPDSIHVESEGSKIKYDIPKNEVSGFDGAEVRLKAPIVDLERYVTER